MLYFDTSFLAPLILPETSSDKVAALMAGLPAAEFAVSAWTGVEFASLLAREVRMGGLDAETARQADAQFEALVEQAFAMLPATGEDFGLARNFLRHYDTGLRAGDALHLAIAARNKATAIYSLDKLFVRAGQALGLPTLAGI